MMCSPPAATTRSWSSAQVAVAPPAHVRGDRARPGPAGLGHDRGLLLVQLRVEDLVGDAASVQLLAQALALLDARGAHEDRTAGLTQLLDLVDEGIPLGRLGAVDEVGIVVADHRPV